MDINCDLGEGTTEASFEKDIQLMDHATSINLACGFHAGHYNLMGRLIDVALDKGLKIGAHPGYDDKENFGRRAIILDAKELQHLLCYQIGAIKTMVEAKGGRLHHVKLHGALYNQCASDPAMARLVLGVVQAIDKNLYVYGPYGSVYNSILRQGGLRVFDECFADRRYEGYKLAPRQEDGVLHDSQAVIDHCRNLVEKKCIVDRNHKTLEVDCQTLCVHGDHEESLEILKALKAFVVAYEA